MYILMRPLNSSFVTECYKQTGCATEMPNLDEFMKFLQMEEDAACYREENQRPNEKSARDGMQKNTMDIACPF